MSVRNLNPNSIWSDLIFSCEPARHVIEERVKDIGKMLRR